MRKAARKKRPRASGTAVRRAGRATTRSTAGPGFAFEDQIAAWLLLKMLTGETMPGMNGRLGLRLQSQTSALGWLIDDLLVTCGPESEESHLALSCKSNLQVTSAGLPHDFVSAAWKQFAIGGTGPLRRGRDRIALVTRGHHPTFQAVWTDIKNACTGSDPALALARIRSTGKHRTVFDNIKKVVQKLSATVRDEDVLEFVRHLLVVSTDFDLDPSTDRESAISQCRRVLTSAAPDEARALWQTLVERAGKARLGDGTIDLPQLWHELRGRFKLNDHPDFSSGWKLLRAYTREHLSNIEATLPSGYSLARSEDGGKLAQAISNNPIVVLYGDSGTGKSALAKSILDRQFPEEPHVWLGPDTLGATLIEVERTKTDLAHPLHTTLKATAHPNNVLVIDAAERISSEMALPVKQLVGALVSEHAPGEIPVWRILIVGQTEAWIDGRLQGLLGDKQPASVELGPAPLAEVQAALRSTAQLSWLALQDDAVAVLANLRALAWVMQAASHFQQQGHIARLSLTAIADSLWKFWTNGQLPLQGMLMRLAEREASFEHSVGLSELSASEALALQEKPSQLPLRITSRNRVEFQHDLAAEWARFQRLKEFSDDTARWAALAQNPLWTGALRMLGQFLLREPINDRTAWDIAFEKLDAPQQGMGLATDILLDALCLDPLAESLLTERADLLFADHGALLNRLLLRFHHIATVPSGQIPLSQVDPSLGLYVEAQNRLPIIYRWPPVIRFLAAHRDRVASLMSPVVAKLCERWLTTMPVELIPGTPMPFRRELAEVALFTARALQVAQGKRFIFGDDSEKPIYAAALAGAPDMPDEVSAWVLEMAQRRPWRTDVVAQIVEFHERQAREHAERLRIDPEYRTRHQQRERMPTFISSARELPPWPLGPLQRVERDFRECCTHSHSLAPLMKARPEVAAEVLLAVLIEDSPEEEYRPHPGLSDNHGMEFDHDSYPTAYWQSAFYIFLQIAPDSALGALIALVDFCTERWDYERQRHGADRISIVLDLPGGTQKEFVGNHSVLDWSQENSTHAGQLHCALAALEKWLCAGLDGGTDVTPYIQRLLDSSRSVAVLGVLLNVGKYRPVLFEGLLRPLLAHQPLYFWDKYRLDTLQWRFDAAAWARQGEAIFQMAREWWSAAYRRVALRSIAAHLVAFKSEIAAYLAAIIKQWELPGHEKAALELRILQAELDRDNYKEDPDGSGRMQFEYPESLQRDVASYQRATEPTLRILMLPHECGQLLGKPAELTAEKAEGLAGFLGAPLPGMNTDVKEDDQCLARIAVASTLLARARPWLDAHPEIRDSARATLRAVVDQIGDDSEFLRGRMLSSRGELEFVAHAVMHDFIRSPASSDAGHAVLRVLTSGNEAAVATLTSLAYAHREQLGGAWWRLLEISLLWCALTVLVPRPDEPQILHKLWGRWLRWLRNRKLTTTDSTLARVDPLAIAHRVERLQRRRWVREFKRERGRFGGDPSTRRSSGLDTHLLKATFTWLFQTPPAGTQQSDPRDTENRLELLKRLLNFELWPHADRREDDRDEPPTQIGYEIVPAIAKVIPGLPLDAAAELWQPLFRLGGSAHYILGHFIDCWLQQVSRNCDIAAFSRHWKAMIEYALASPQWSSGRHWYYGERLLCRLLGCGSELSLDQVTELQTTVLKMKDLYESWADKHLDREEDHITYFCGFLSSSTGRLLRLVGLQWLHRSIRQQAPENLHWRRSGTAGAVTNLLDVMLTENIDELTTNALARDALLELVAILVKQQAPVALALQERASAKLAGKTPRRPSQTE
ncbi:MAG TPA: ATP-binding protein [Acidobacteriaceae bacterium]